jgi:Ca2+-binding RTX toxin-like protein
MANLINGLGGAAGFGTGTLGAIDDGSSSQIDLSSIFPDGLDFFGVTYTSLFVNNNGNLSLGAPHGSYTFDFAAATGVAVIAPYAYDADTRSGPHGNHDPAGNSTGSNLVWWDLDASGDGIFTATWDDTGIYSQDDAEPNAFQVQIVGRGNGDFDIVFRYEDIRQDNGGASDPDDVSAGYTVGDGEHFFELPGSGTSAQLDLETTLGNSGLAGLWVFEVRNGGTAEHPAVALGGGPDFYDAGGGNDIVSGGDGADTIHGGSGGDILQGDGGNDQLRGQSGDDLLNGGDGDDELLGGEDQDTLHGGRGGDLLRGQSGNDTLAGGEGADTLNGGDHNDTLDGGLGDDILRGEDGNDLLRDGAGSDTLNGGSGVDTVTYQGRNSPVTVDLSGGLATAGGETDLLFDLENAIGGSGGDTLIGNGASNRLEGGAGNDRVSGEASNDSLFGGAGGDQVFGGANDDELEGGDGNDRLFGGDGSDDLFGGGGADQLFGGDGNDNSGLHGGAGNDKLFGEGGHDWLYGNEDHDRLEGGAGEDHLYGSDGRDTLLGGADDDYLSGSGSGIGGDMGPVEDGDADELVGGAGDDYYVVFARDTVVERNNEGADTVEAAANFTLGSYLENLVLTGDAVVGNGNAVDNRIAGNGLGNALQGRGGDDELYGNAGDDTLDGGAGDDHLDGGDDNDTLNGGAGDDYLYGEDHSDMLSGGTGDDEMVGGDGDDLLLGGDGDDRLTDGNGGFNVLDGEDGEDELSLDAGAFGQSYAYGGNGKDTFFVSSSNGGASAHGYGFGAEGDDDGSADWFELEALNSGWVTAEGGDGDDEFVVFASDEGTASAFGGAGDDVFDVGAGWGYGEAYGGQGNDLIVLTADDNGYLYGDGGAGDDSLTAMGFEAYGSAELTGGQGSDLFVVDVGSGYDNHYLVTDFNPDEDRTILVGVGEEDVENHETGDFDGDGHDDDLRISVAVVDEFSGLAFNTVTFLGVDDIADLDLDLLNFTGSESNDALVGNNLDNEMAGLGGDDRIEGLGGDDSIDGGEGDDALYGGSSDADEGDGPTLLDFEEDSDGDDVLLGGAGDDFLFGGTGRDRLEGGDGDDILDGRGDGEGDIGPFLLEEDALPGDTLLGGAGNDRLWGGEGDDIDSLHGEAGDDELLVIFGSAALYGDEGDDLLLGLAAGLGGPFGGDEDAPPGTMFMDGGDGDDEITAAALFAFAAASGGGGDDLLSAHALLGFIELDGGDGDDWLELGSVFGIVSLAGGAGADTFAMSLGFLEGGFIPFPVGSERVIQDFTPGVDRVVLGGITQEHLDAAEFDAEAGGLRISVGHGEEAESVVFVGIESVAQLALDRVNLTGADSAGFAGVAEELPPGFLPGSIVAGNELDNVVDGRGGDDILSGGAGSDTLIGGAGRDQFVFGEEEGTTTIVDFEDGVDTLDLNRDLPGDFIENSASLEGGHVVIRYEVEGGMREIHLLGVRMDELDLSDFGLTA